MPVLFPPQSWPPVLWQDSGPEGIELPHVTMSSIIGVTVAISGNVLISLALNLQKLAHRRLESEKLARAGDERDKNRARRVEDVIEEHEREEEDNGEYARFEPNTQPFPSGGSSESMPLLTNGTSLVRDYGASPLPSPNPISVPAPKRTFMSRLNPFPLRRSKSSPATASSLDVDPDASHALIPVEITSADELNKPRRHKTSRRLKSRNKLVGTPKPEPEPEGKESDYLKSKLWWTGFLLMNVGEIGNFISYAFAPASVVAPLGTFALIANCAFAPLLLHERFRKREIFGVLVAIVGAITVVFSSNTSDTKLDPHGLIEAICQQAFITYAIVYLVGMVILSGLSRGELGRRYVFIDVGLCALFGGFTVLSTKGVSTLLTTRGFEMFAEWISYPLIVVLIGTGVGQIRYLNRALMRFDGKVVIPIQFVLFNLSAIVGSAILYGDFRRATFHEMVTFLYGCAATFAGVFIIAWAPSGAPDVEASEFEYDGDAGQSEIASEAGVGGGAGGGIGNGFGSVGRRRAATLVLPSGSQPVLRNKTSTVSLIGLSPAQGLLLVHTPPRDGIVGRPGSSAGFDRDVTATPNSVGRQRVVSWASFNEDGRSRSQERRRVLMYGSATGTRENSLVRNGNGSVESR
ncbi:DUF803-domain-containing protein [Gloeophyllum trabeum ATCC 11539]|uniref:DUF803-domain-containing protein n=1 Tax=Gloeophyllum trabeum (strain ATCC 11539 / FP-39264 / Madison 617) TaxID=670483 RepID=S7RWT3_GLOTA|nr:DUF803-domain-containing protein [Gloeophyllum trabeum ATCC 11539]EPQ59360.1 DUF803-domain-containing protein [Gloeophyllum trabeum ATCC 11539]